MTDNEQQSIEDELEEKYKAWTEKSKCISYL